MAAIEILLPLAKEEYRQLSGPRSSTCDPRTAELIKSEADAWAIGIALAEVRSWDLRPYETESEKTQRRSGFSSHPTS